MNDLNNQRTLSFKEIFLYGFGGMFAYGFQLVLTGYFLNYFMTDVLMIPTALAATLNLIVQFTKVFSMAIAGAVIDSTNPKAGRYRVWFLLCGIAMGITLPLTFTNFGIEPGKAGILFIVFYVIMMFSYNFGWTALRALAGKLGKTGNDATILGSAANVAGTIPSVLYMLFGAAFLALPTPFLKGVNNPYLNFGLLSGLMILLGGFIIYRLASRVEGPNAEAVVEAKAAAPKQEKIGLLTMIKNLKGPGLVYLLALIVDSVQSGTFSVLLPYYCNYVLKNPGITLATIGVNAGLACIGSFFVPVIAKKFGKKPCFIAYHFVMAALYVVLAMVGNNGTGFVVVRGIQTMVSCFGICFMPAFMSDVADYNEMKGVQGARGFLQSMAGTGTRLGSSLAAVVASFALSIIGYVAGGEVTPAITKGFTTLLIVVPGIAAALSGLLMFFYKIDEKELNEYRVSRNQ
ncbi:MAG: MFS transporter [Firmicutes bacterium]|nr:MFS transporter [Bacillota bacterium]